MTKERFKIEAYVALLLKKNNKILLLERCNTGYLDNNWCFPGGGLDQNETLDQAAIREGKEELNIIIDKADIQLIHVMHQNLINKQTIGFYFLVTSWTGEPINNEPQIHSQIAWFDLNNLPKLLAPSTRQAINLYNKQILYSTLS